MSFIPRSALGTSDMPLTLNCPKCHKPFRVRDESIGGRVRCPSCGAVLQVPATLAPGSGHGVEAPPNDLPPGEVTGAHRPIAEDVTARKSVGSLNDLLLGGSGRSGGRADSDIMDVGHSAAGTALPGPPSIKARGVTAPAPAADFSRSPAPVANDRVPKAPRPLSEAPLGPRPGWPPPPNVERAWGKVQGGLQLVRWGLFLFALTILGFVGHAAWIYFAPDAAMKEGPGFLKREGWPLWKEVMGAYTAIPIAIGVLLVFLGRLRCLAAPAEAHAKGLALGAAFFTLLAVLSIGVYLGWTYLDLGQQIQLPPEVAPHVLPIATVLALPSVVLADVLTLLFVGQIGWPVMRPKLQRAVGGWFVLTALIPPAILIGYQFYPLLGPSIWEQTRHVDRMLTVRTDEEATRRVLIWGGIVAASALAIVLRYASIVGGGRKGIKRYLAGTATR